MELKIVWQGRIMHKRSSTDPVYTDSLARKWNDGDVEIYLHMGSKSEWVRFNFDPQTMTATPGIK